MPNFEVFTKRMIPLVKQPYVTIQKRGTLSLNAAAHAAVGGADIVELLFDPTARIVGIRAAADDTVHGYPLRAQGGKDSGPFLVSGRAFAAYYKIDTTTSRRYPAEVQDGILCVDLSVEGIEVTSNRSTTHADDDSSDSEEP